jgi:hypothetical protein
MTMRCFNIMDKIYIDTPYYRPHLNKQKEEEEEESYLHIARFFSVKIRV